MLTHAASDMSTGMIYIIKRRKWDKYSRKNREKEREGGGGEREQRKDTTNNGIRTNLIIFPLQKILFSLSAVICFSCFLAQRNARVYMRSSPFYVRVCFCVYTYKNICVSLISFFYPCACVCINFRYFVHKRTNPPHEHTVHTEPHA